MSNQVFCPSCQKPQYPQIKSGRQVCHDCGVALPSSFSEANRPFEESHPGSSSTALDDFSTVPSQPTGAMTLLRSNLRSEQQSKSGGWLDTILPRRPKMPIDQDSPPSSRVNLEPSEVSNELEPPRRPTRNAPEPAFPSSSPEPRTSDTSDVVSRSGKAASIVAVVTVLAFGSIASVGLLRGKSAWADVMFLATIAMLGVAILGILNRKNARRAFWQGFALFGLGYLALAFAPWSPHQIRVELPTTRLLVELHAKVAPLQAAGNGPGLGRPIQKAASAFVVAGSLNQFLEVGHCLFTLTAGLLGSWIGRRLYRTDLAPAWGRSVTEWQVFATEVAGGPTRLISWVGIRIS